MHDSEIIGPYIIINSKSLINLCSNDYLGITRSKISNKQNQSSSRLIAGNDNSLTEGFEVYSEIRIRLFACNTPSDLRKRWGHIIKYEGYNEKKDKKCSSTEEI